MCYNPGNFWTCYNPELALHSEQALLSIMITAVQVATIISAGGCTINYTVA